MTFDDFLTEVLPSVPGCPDQVAVNHIIKAARTFAGRTLAWNYSAPTIPAEAGKGDYTLQLGPEQELVRVLGVFVDDTEYACPKGVYGRRETRRSNGNFCTMQGPFDFVLSPAPSVEGASIITDIAVKPTLTSTYWPDDLAEHVPDIAAGAIESLCLLPKMEWTNPALALAMGQKFTQRISVVGYKVSRGLSTSRKSAEVVWF